MGLEARLRAAQVPRSGARPEAARAERTHGPDAVL